jgi:alpha-methylacyl-CoA racemase
MAPPTLVGDLGGGALYLAMGMLAGILHARSGGTGQVVDAAIVDGSANLMNLILSLHAGGLQPMERGRGMLDGSHWYNSYICADGQYISLGALEPQFYALLLDKLALQGDAEFQRQYDGATWAELRGRLAGIFASQPRAHWVALLEGTDACFAPVLTPRQAASHPHMAARGTYMESDGLFQGHAGAALLRRCLQPARPRAEARPTQRRGVAPSGAQRRRNWPIGRCRMSADSAHQLLNS